MTRTELEALADEAADLYGIPRAGLRAQVARESSWNPIAVGAAGEIGLLQLLPAAIADTGLSGDPFDPWTNLRMGARYLQMQFQRFGSWPLALAAYNGGGGNVNRSVRERGDAWLSGMSSGARAYVAALAPSFEVPNGPGPGASALVSLLLVGLAAWWLA